jgi:hypothetical protein
LTSENLGSLNQVGSRGDAQRDYESKQLHQKQSRKINLIEINFNFNFLRTTEGPKPKLPIKRVLAFLAAALACLTNGVQAPVIARPTVKIVSPASGSTFVAGSTVPIVARATNATGVKSIEFYVNGVKAGKRDRNAPE